MVSGRTDIIVPQWNKSEYTCALLDSIKDAGTEKYRVLLIENGSEQAHVIAADDALRDHPHEVIRNKENLGFIQGVNQGLKLAMAEGSTYVCIQNNDTLVDPGWLDKMLEVFQKETDVGMVGPTAIWASSWQSRTRLIQKWGDPIDWDKWREIHSMLAFFCTVIPVEVIEEVGLLDEQYGLGFGDDDDYAMRIKRAGYRMFIRTDVTVAHHHRTTFKAQVPKWKTMQRVNVSRFKKNWQSRPPSVQR